MSLIGFFFFLSFFRAAMNLGRSTQYLQTLLPIYVYIIVYSLPISTRPDTQSTELRTKGLQDHLSKVYTMIYQRSTERSTKGLHRIHEYYDWST